MNTNRRNPGAALNGLALAVLTMALVAIIYLTAGFVASESRHQAVLGLISDIQFRRSDDLEALEQELAELRAVAPIGGAYDPTYAQGLGLLRQQGGEATVDNRSLIDAYTAALQTEPHNGYLWAGLAGLLATVEGGGDRFSKSLEAALQHGAYDYNTMRLLLAVGIRMWPSLNCQHKTAILEVIRRALRMDDHIVSRWNAELRQNALGPYAQSLMVRYDFGLPWAEREVRRCQVQ